MHSYQLLHGGNLENFFIRLVIKSLNTSFADINRYAQACLAESQAEFTFILSVQSMALVAVHIHVDNLIADAVNIVTLGLFFNSSKIFYCYNCSIYIFFRPRVSLHNISNKALLILEDKLYLFTPGIGQP